MTSIIPENLKKAKKQITTYLSWMDLIVFTIYIPIWGSMFALTIIPFWIRGILAFIIFLSLFWTLFNSPKYNLKFYMLFLNWLKFKISKKTFSNKELSANTSLLVPYNKIIDDFIETDVLQTKKRQYIGVLEIKGYDLSTYDESEQMIKLDQIADIFRYLNLPFTLVVVNKPLNLEDNVLFYKTVKEKLKKLSEFKKITKEEFQSRCEWLDSYIENLGMNNNRSIMHYKNVKKFYMYIYAEKIQELKQQISLAEDKIFNSGLSCLPLNKYELVNSIKSIFNPFEPEWSHKNIDDNINNLKKLFRMEQIIFNKNAINANGIYYGVTGIHDYPFFPNNGWTANIAPTDTTLIWNFNNVSSEEITKDLEGAISMNETSLFQTKSSKRIGISKLGNKLEILGNMVNTITSGSETIKRGNLLFLHYGVDKKTVLNSVNRLSQLLKEEKILIDRLIYRQFEGYSSIIPKSTDSLLFELGREMPCSTIANGFMWINNSLNDKKGMLLGFNTTGDILLWDQFFRNMERKNSNLFLIGTSGDGKTTFLKKIIAYNTSLGKKVIVIDPEREYTDLCKHLNGIVIDLGSGVTGIINPLQVIPGFEEKQTTQSLISDHLQCLEIFFKYIIELNDDELRILIKCIYELYDDFKIINKKIEDIKNNEFPIFSDLLIKLESKKNENVLCKRLYEIIKWDFTGTGKYSLLWNNYSTINFNQNLFYVLDIKTLFQKNQRICAAQMCLVLRYVYNLIDINRFKEKNNLLIVIDEAHIIIDPKNPEGLMFMFRMVKMIRKYSGGIIVATQNIHDFKQTDVIERETTAVLNNSQYVGIMGLKQKDLIDVQDLYRASGGLSKQEITFISKAATGEMLFCLSDHIRHCITVEYNNFEVEKLFVKNGGE
ncbi:hypothetical protein S100390_v1c03940 [Spiroplasma sp. NBRC 100390]|uniref:Mbov_0397 family ICE element conjugal transfer ATPase n=1 Tax=unclassified Spiroplasma TaxID=2637901 RepID=UPI0008929BD6|nr:MULTISPECIES: ATP-binding protein [unclassified Spiroplasma]AOX43737.1 hypothetical protein STU14_v1c03940 [Spiroplasma sp. TU-14]APE13207.1 hypothetical protein S100390_v1c03940 [Spiroplasma sp. NBRC 100390]